MPGPEMRAQYLKWGLVAACIVTLWLMMMNFLDQEFKQNDFPKKTRIQLCHCPRNSFRKCRCSFEIRKCSACLRVRGTSVWFDERFETAIEPVQRPEDPISSDALILWLVGAQSWSLSSPYSQPHALPISPFMAPHSNLLPKVVRVG